MIMSREQRIAIVESAIEVLEHHPPSLESYTKYYYYRYVRRCLAHGIKPTVDGFFDQIPDVSRTPRKKAHNEYAALLGDLYREFDELVDLVEPKTAPAKASPPQKPLKKAPAKKRTPTKKKKKG